MRRLATLLLFLVSVSVVVSACASSNMRQARQAQNQWDDAFGSLRGQDSSKVLEVAGAPDEKLDVGGFEVWRYRRKYGTTSASAEPGSGHSITIDEPRYVVLDVYLRDGRVDKHTSRIE